MRKSYYVIIVVLVAAIGVGVWYLGFRSSGEETEVVVVQEEQGPAKYSPEWFASLFSQLNLPNVEKPASPPVITGSPNADEHIRGLAEARGYQLEPVATGGLVDVEAVRAQAALAEAWQQLKAAALAETGDTLSLISGYRSVESQREIFLARFDEQSVKVTGHTYTTTQIALGQADAVLDAVLAESSIPGYSEHHSGYAIDIEDTTSGKSFEEFGQTKGFEWLSQNDYQNARRFGFIPGYPEGATNVGPNPEAWHILWVGAANL